MFEILQHLYETKWTNDKWLIRKKILSCLTAGLCANETDKTVATIFHAGVPFLLQSIKEFGYNVAESTQSAKSYFHFNWHLPDFISRSYWTTTNNFPQSSLLSDQQYADLIQHINAYIKRIVVEQSQSERTVSPEANNILIASIVKENILNYKYQLSLEDIERIANVVREKLRIEEGESKLNIPIEEHKEFIANVVKENVNVHLSASRNQNDGDIDVDAVLAKIFGSAKFIEIIDQEIVNQMDPHQRKIWSFEEQIQFMNSKLSEKAAENQDLKYSIDLLKKEHDNLLGKIQGYKTDVDIKLEKSLNDVDLKLTTLNANQLSMIDNRVKLILLDIMGYANSNEKPTEDNLKAWIKNVFVAKEYLEQRLNELSLKFDKNLKDEFDRSAAILMGDVGERIKSQTLLLINSKTEGGTLDEVKIRSIVGEILAVYDADKTGLVDYALESAGGEVLSTR